MKFAPFFKRICKKMKIKSKRELAEILELSPSSIYSAKRRDSVPPRWILKLSQRHNFNVNWLLTGMGEPLMDKDNAFKSISVVEARLSAGGGSLEVGAETVDEVPFRLDWLHRKGVPDKMVMFKISGDSMEPVVHDGDTVLVDMSRKEIVNGKIFAIGVDDAIVLKRVEKKEDHIKLISENNTYPPEIHSADQTQGFRIIGKMIWSSREYV